MVAYINQNAITTNANVEILKRNAETIRKNIAILETYHSTANRNVEAKPSSALMDPNTPTLADLKNEGYNLKDYTKVNLTDYYKNDVDLRQVSDLATLKEKADEAYRLYAKQIRFNLKQ